MQYSQVHLRPVNGDEWKERVTRIIFFYYINLVDDAERNDGSSQHPKTSTSYYISEKLIKILTKEGIQDVLQVDSEFWYQIRYKSPS